jgi:hypothetical protein
VDIDQGVWLDAMFAPMLHDPAMWDHAASASGRLADICVVHAHDQHARTGADLALA